MNQLDVYYRALLDYRQQTTEDRNCTALRTAIATSDTERDKIVITRYNCTIERDWVDAIEAGLIHVEKALKEERQFIRSNGEVVPIEKVKHVSRESVEHLAKHSDLITKCENIENIIPEKLYTVERLNDYAVYENRFLYMLLCFLRDFITIRYNDILDLSNKYEADLNLNKTVISGKQKMNYSVSLHDVKRDDQYLKETNPAKDLIDKIHLLLKTVIAFLNTPLMQEVSKVAMLKPPITKTNVLKMNNNFKGAVALYEFIMAYDKKGYTIEEQVITLSPFEDMLADELAEAGGLLSFLVYEYGLALNQQLKKNYLREEELRKVEKIRARAERIEALKRKLKNSEISIEEYTVTLEDQLRDLAGEADRAEALLEELNTEREKNKNLERLVKEQSETIAQLHSYIEELKHKHFEEIRRLKKEHEDEMHALILKHEAEMQACIEKYENEIRELNERHAEELQREREAAAEAARRHAEELEETRRLARERIEQIQSEHAAAIAEITSKHSAEIQEMESRHAAAVQEAENRHNAIITETEGMLSSCKTELQHSKKLYSALLEQSRLDKARIKALGGITENYTDRENFNELEREYNAFTRIYKQQWELTKKEIKKKHLNLKNLMAKPEKTKDEEENKTVDEENSSLTPPEDTDNA